MSKEDIELEIQRKELISRKDIEDFSIEINNKIQELKQSEYNPRNEKQQLDQYYIKLSIVKFSKQLVLEERRKLQLQYMQILIDQEKIRIKEVPIENVRRN